MFCLLPVQLFLSLAEPAHVFPVSLLHVAVQPSSVSSQPLQAWAGVPWVVVEISTEILSPKHLRDQKGRILVPEGWICDRQAEQFSSLSWGAAKSLREQGWYVMVEGLFGYGGIIWVWRWWAQGLLDCLLWLVGEGICRKAVCLTKKLLLLRTL